MRLSQRVPGFGRLLHRRRQFRQLRRRLRRLRRPGNPAGLSSGTIEIKYTLLGDANLDGTVNGIDFGILTANFNKSVSRWDQGDFNYDNIVNGIGFASLAALQSFAAANGLLADIPEPASVVLLCAALTRILHTC